MNNNELRSAFEKETKYKAIGKNGTYHSKYGKWLENMVVKNCSIPDVVFSEAEVCDHTPKSLGRMIQCEKCGKILSSF